MTTTPAAQTGERAEQTGGKGTDEQDEAEEKNGHGEKIEEE